MKQPVWILNSSLLVVCCISQLLLFMLQQAVPRKVSIVPDAIEIEQEKIIDPVDIARIYQHDLFGTYQPAVTPVKSSIEDSIPAIPLPPRTILPEIPVEKAPIFFAPIDAILKGVIFVKDQPASCIAIVQLKKTKEERNYQVGDLIEDAQILKILSNRIIIIRANGQQETLYLREEDAAFDFNKEVRFEPRLIVEEQIDSTYIINIDEFTYKIPNLGEFINALDVTTVYKQGKSFGCRVGRIEKDSLGELLGFQPNDIIIKVDDLPVDDVNHRLAVYDHMIHKRAGSSVVVTVLRGQDEIELQYGLIDKVMKSMNVTPEQLHKRLVQELDKHERDHQASVIVQNYIPEQAEQDNLIDDSLEEADFEQAFNAAQNDYIQSFSDQFMTQHRLPETLHQADTHKKKIVAEQEHFVSISEKLRDRDRNTMRQNSKNIILGSMQ